MRGFERFAGGVAFAVALGGVAYSVAFVLAVRTDIGLALPASFVLLLLGGLLSSAVLVGIYVRVREADPGFALWGLLVATVGTMGSAIHGGFDLARSLPVDSAFAISPNAVDPRGLLTFGFTGVGLAVLAGSIRRAGTLPSGLARLGTALGILLVLVYLGRLLIVDPNNPVLLGLAAVTGLIAHPVWFVWLGVGLRRPPPAA